MEFVNRQMVRDLMVSGKSYAEISEILVEEYPNVRGLSCRSVRRFCKKYGISKKKGPQLDAAVNESIQEVGELFGRKMMKGYLQSKAIFAGEHNLAKAMKRVSPVGYEGRRHDTINRTNPIPYSAMYFGHKLHMDQNEKLVRYGVTHVLSIDGYSSKIISNSVMPIKNNLKIYDEVYRYAILKYGLWDQIRVDYGREFYLSLYVQNKLRSIDGLGSCDVQPYMQTNSCNNLTVERIWVYINSRVNYPIKRILCAMEENDVLDLTDDTMMFSVSTVVMETAKIGMDRFVASWNCHSVSGKGIPNTLAAGSLSQITPVPLYSIPSTHQAVQEYEQQQGILTHESIFGQDMLAERPDLMQRRKSILLQEVSFENIFSDIVSGNGQSLQFAITRHCQVTERLSALI